MSNLDTLNVTSDLGVAAALETKRLAEKYGKDFLDCDDLVKVLGVDLNNVKQLMCSTDFPVLKIGNRKVVSVVAFALWALNSRSL